MKKGRKGRGGCDDDANEGEVGKQVDRSDEEQPVLREAGGCGEVDCAGVPGVD